MSVRVEASTTVKAVEEFTGTIVHQMIPDKNQTLSTYESHHKIGMTLEKNQKHRVPLSSTSLGSIRLLYLLATGTCSFNMRLNGENKINLGNDGGIAYANLHINGEEVSEGDYYELENLTNKDQYIGIFLCGDKAPPVE